MFSTQSVYLLVCFSFFLIVVWFLAFRWFFSSGFQDLLPMRWNDVFCLIRCYFLVFATWRLALVTFAFLLCTLLSLLLLWLSTYVSYLFLFLVHFVRTKQCNVVIHTLRLSEIEEKSCKHFFLYCFSFHLILYCFYKIYNENEKK